MVIHCVSMEFKLYESLNRWIHAKVWEWIVVLVPIGHMGVPKRDTNIASPYKAIKCERNMFWMSWIWINWFALLFLKVWWSKHSKLVTLFGTVVIFSASLWIGFCELASQKPKKSHLERSSTGGWCNTGAAPGHLNLRWWGLYMKFRDLSQIYWWRMAILNVSRAFFRGPLFSRNKRNSSGNISSGSSWVVMLLRGACNRKLYALGMLRRYSSLSSGVHNPVKRKRDFTSYTDEDQFFLKYCNKKSHMHFLLASDSLFVMSSRGLVDFLLWMKMDRTQW